MAPRYNNKAARRNLQTVADITSTPPPVLLPTQIVAKVNKAMGNNLYSLQTASNEVFLAELPSRFRSTIWIRRGGFVVVDKQAFLERENKIDGEIINIVRHQKEWRKMSYWPAEFTPSTMDHDQEAEDDDGDGTTIGKMPPSPTIDGE